VRTGSVQSGKYDEIVYAGVTDLKIIKILEERRRKADPYKYSLERKKND